MNIADIIIPEYRYTPLPHPESIRILVLHPAEDRDAPIVCSFLDENPIVPTIEETQCRAVDPPKCDGCCLLGSANGHSYFDSAEAFEYEFTDEMEEPAIDDMHEPCDAHGGEDGSTTTFDTFANGRLTNTNEQDVYEQFNSMDVAFCGACGYDFGNEDHDNYENDEYCTCFCHCDDSCSDDSADTSSSGESFVISPWQGKWHEKVSRPANFPEYEAISYTWGDTADSLPITLGSDKAQIFVTQNCHAALQNLRFQTSVRLLWIDALCINQKDIAERTNQVRIMGRVYAASYQVVIYLGDETPSSRLLFEELALYEQATSVNQRKPRQEVIEAVEDLLDRPWFNRVWVLQEASNSKLAIYPTAAMVCGASSVRSRTLISCVFGFTGTRVTRHYLPYSLRACYEEVKTNRLWTTIVHTLDCAATDPRDQIFALQGLKGGNDVPFQNLINYADGFEVTFFKVAQYLLKAESDLSVLSLIKHPHHMGMPSWIPSWENRCQSSYHTSRSYINHQFTKNNSFASARDTFETQVRTCSCAKCTGKHTILRARGFEVSIVKLVGTPFTANDAIVLEEQVRNLLSQFDEHDNWGREEAHQNPDKIILQGLRARKYGPLETLILLIRSYEIDKYAAEWLANGNRSISESLSASLPGYSIYLDSTGELGLVPKETQPGDVICYIKQAHFPILLRPRNEGGWVLISGFCSRGDGDFDDVLIDDFLSAGCEEVEFDIW